MLLKSNGISQLMIATLKKIKHIEDAMGRSKVDSKRKRFIGAINDIDKASLRWFLEIRKHNVPISGPMISSKSRKSKPLLGNNNFKANNGWLLS